MPALHAALYGRATAAVRFPALLGSATGWNARALVARAAGSTTLANVLRQGLMGVTALIVGGDSSLDARNPTLGAALAWRHVFRQRWEVDRLQRLLEGNR
jgi:hypothetical protein